MGCYAVLTDQYRHSDGGNAFICRVQQSKKTGPQDGCTTQQAISYKSELMFNNYYFLYFGILKNEFCKAVTDVPAYTGIHQM